MQQMPELKVVKVDTDELLEYTNNAKLHPASQIDSIAASISEFGFNSPILAWHNEDGEPEIVAGHGRLLAARKLGIKELPVVFVDHLTEEQRRAYIIADNKTAEGSEWNILGLSRELINIDIDMSDFGFSDTELDNLIGLANDFFAPVEIDYEEQDERGGMFAPNVAPTESNSLVTEKTMETAQKKQSERFSSQSVESHNIVICPNCGKEFEID